MPEGSVSDAAQQLIIIKNNTRFANFITVAANDNMLQNIEVGNIEYVSY